jgi:hypothetical protein
LYPNAQVWEKAAEALRELAKVGNLVFPGLEQIRGSCAGGGGGGQGSETAAPASVQMEVGRKRIKKNHKMCNVVQLFPKTVKYFAN